MPFDTTRIIPTGWSANHAQNIPTSYNAKIAISDPARTTTGPLDPTTGTYPDRALHYIAGGPGDINPLWRQGVPCRIDERPGGSDAEQAGQLLTTREYLVQLPFDVPDIEVGYVGTVTAAPNDTHLVGVTLTATDVIHGSERFNRDVVFAHNQQPDARQE